MKNIKLFVLVASVFLLGGICLLAVGISVGKMNRPDSTNIEDIARNWSINVIQDIGTCSEESNMNMDSFWEGSVEGCFCPGTNEFTRDSCTEEGCTKSEALRKIQLLKWRSVNLCSDTSESYFALNIASNTEGCAKSFRSCGNIDSLDNQLCIPIGAPCPINRIRFSQTEPSTSKFVKGNSSYLVYSREEQANIDIPIQIKATEGEICSNLKERSYKRELHPFETFYGNSTCSETVARTLFNRFYSRIDVYDTFSLFTENMVTDKLKKLPNFDFNSLKVPIYLESRSYVGLRKDCFDRVKDKELQKGMLEVGEDASSAADLGNVTFTLVGIFFGLSVLLLVPAFLLFREDNKLWSLLSSGGVVLLKLIVLILCVVLFVQTDSLDLGLGELGADECSDSISNEILIEFSDSVREPVPLMIFALSVAVFDLVAASGLLVYVLGK